MAGLLHGQRALVTGASRGIGRAVAGRLREDGATVLTVARGGEADRHSIAADLIACRVSPRAATITGAEFRIDGGALPIV